MALRQGSSCPKQFLMNNHGSLCGLRSPVWSWLTQVGTHAQPQSFNWESVTSREVGVCYLQRGAHCHSASLLPLKCYIKRSFKILLPWKSDLPFSSPLLLLLGVNPRVSGPASTPPLNHFTSPALLQTHFVEATSSNGWPWTPDTLSPPPPPSSGNYRQCHHTWLTPSVPLQCWDWTQGLMHAC